MLKLKRKKKINEVEHVPPIDLPFETPLYMIKKNKINVKRNKTNKIGRN